MAPPRSAHVQLDDVLAFLIQQDGKVAYEFRTRRRGDGGDATISAGLHRALRKYDRG